MNWPSHPGRNCGACAHFRNDPAFLEAAIPGWASLGSAWGSTCAEDGICDLHELYLSAGHHCDRFEGREQVAGSGATLGLAPDERP